MKHAFLLSFFVLSPLTFASGATPYTCTISYGTAGSGPSLTSAFQVVFDGNQSSKASRATVSIPNTRERASVSSYPMEGQIAVSFAVFTPAATIAQGTFFSAPLAEKFGLAAFTMKSKYYFLNCAKN